MLIKNKKELAKTKLRKQVLELAEAGIKSVLPRELMRKAVKYNRNKKILTIKKSMELSSEASELSSIRIKDRIFVIGGGKASGSMAEEIEEIIGVKNITAGIVNCKNTNYKTKKIKIHKATHPTPSQKGVDGVEEMLSLKSKYNISKDDLIICLISGGGSAIMPCPVDEISLEDKQEISKLLIASGATIHEINKVRKHVSKIKGGQLGRHFAPAKVISLIISDVIGDDLDVIASGPTAPDSTTFKDAYNILKKHQLISKAPKSVLNYLKKGMQDKNLETPKGLNNCYNYIIGNNRLALKTMEEKAKKLGLKPFIITDKQVGPPDIAAKARAKEILNNKYSSYNTLLIGGETTPKLPKNHGLGGRNQHYAATTIIAMKKHSGAWAMASVGTDGSDYLQNIAGGIVDNNTLNEMKNKKINIESYLKKYDSYNLLKKISNSLILTGETGTNVGDIMIYIFN
ncbi:MAG: DUF4147 domain-containing protein [Patescibacteria group bacterium]